MSVQESLGSPTAVRPRPEIPPKPAAPSDPDGGGRPGAPGGKVKNIVNKFSKPANGSGEPGLGRRSQRPPTIKPKPRRTSLPLQMGAERAPPLPRKRTRGLRKQSSVGGEEGEGVCAEEDRSAPDGKEGEEQLAGGGEAEAERGPDPPPSPCCPPGCGCACHLQRPGMKLAWVPLDWEDNGRGGAGGEEHDSESEVDVEIETGEEGDSEEEEDLYRSPVLDERAEAEKARFHQTLEVAMAEGQRRLSDPGPRSALSSLVVSQGQTPSVPPKQSASPPADQHPSQCEEDSIYDMALPTVDPLPKQVPGVPQITVCKPPRRSKLPHSTSDPTSDFEPGYTPPAVPPRVPLTPGGRSLTPGPRAGVPLPMPTAEELRSFRSSSPSSPRRAPPQPPAGSLQPHRAPPPPPKVDPRRLSSASVQSAPPATGREDENGGNEDEKEDAEVSVVKRDSLRRKISSIWQSRLQNEPLYQTYRATVITKEIRRQTVCRNISKTSADYAMEWAAPRNGGGPEAAGAGGGPRPGPAAAPAQSTLWQDLPRVRESGVLANLSHEQCRYQESMFEVLTSEASYLRSLHVLTDHFLNSRELEETMIIRERKTLFSNILRVREVSERFLKDLEDRTFEDVVIKDICDIIHYHSQHNFPAYIDYVRNQIYQEQTYTTLMKNNVQFAAVIARLQESPQCQRLPFMSFLLLPFQRITRIKMLIENILKRTQEGTAEEGTASKALASVSKIIDECNTQVGRMRQMEELIQLSNLLEFDKLKAIPIISQTRYLEKKGELMEMSKGATIFNMRGKFSTVYLFLFNDLLILTTKKSSERYVVLDHAHRSLVQVQPLDEDVTSGSPYEHCFNLTLLENHQGRLTERLFKAPSQSDMHRWLAAFPHPTGTETEDDEVIYEDWDCPQVQCVEQYVAQQADELTLEPTEIVNVLRKTNEGWYEGNRLSDGQKGWFPVANVIEITNEHVRRRNIRERYRVMRAASLVARKARAVQ
ncbi:rho guanine nucleotide exchange factor 15 isoform 1-T2 [Menidia menidia]